jgi:hypothetical protein
MNRATIRRLYRDAILQVFGCSDKKLDASLIKATKSDVHFSDRAPGQWSPESILEIYCESGIPNASDINEIPPMPEFGIMKGSCVYNSDLWCRVDGIVNLMLEITHPGLNVYHEPQNAAVVNIYEC